MKLFLIITVLLTSLYLNGQTIDSTAIKQVDSLINVSHELTDKRDFDKALEINAVAEKLSILKFSKESALYAKTCFNKGRVYSKKDNFTQAEKYYLQAISIQEKVLGKESPDYASSLNNLGNLYYEMSNYEKAEPLFLEASAIRGKVLGKGHLDYAASMNNLGNLYSDMGNYEKAEPFYIAAKSIWEKVLGKEHPYYALSINNLGILYSDMGDNKKAEQYYLEAKSIREKVLGKGDPDYAASLNNLGSLYYEMSNYEKAEPLFIEASAIWKKVLGKDNPDYAKSLQNLALLYVEMGQYEKAEPHFLEALAIREKVLGKEHPDYASSLNNLGMLYFKMSNFEKAEPLFLEASDIWEKVLGKEHPQYASSLNNLGSLYLNMGNYEKAESLYLKAIEIRKKVLGKDHPDYTASLISLGSLYLKTENYKKALPILSEYFKLTQSILLKSSTFLSEKELSKYVATFQKDEDMLFSQILTSDKKNVPFTAFATLSYDNSLFNKGFLLNAVGQIKRLVNTDSISTIKFNQLKSYRRRLAAEYSNPINERKGLADLEEKANTSEKELARIASGYKEASKQVKWQDVQNSLKGNEAAIEFINFKINFPESTGNIMYAALVLKPGLQQPLFIQLFEEKSLDSILQSKGDRRLEYVNDLYSFASRGATALEAKKRSLAELIFKPLEKELIGIKTIYYSPSGLLHRINLDAIPISETETLADRYNLVELNSTRQLVVPTVVKNTNNDAVLFGGIQFNADTTLVSDQQMLASRSESQLSFSQTNPKSRGGSWDYLPGTEREVNAIDKIMSTSGIKTTLKKGNEGTEEAFKNIGANHSPSPRILHIATHGYFFPDPKENNSKNAFGNDEPVFKISDLPMLRSGLILAGGNNTWKGKKMLEGKEDGILTAYEISQMNLSNTELVVLSACETGLGEIDGNEGVYGLQRAFKIAGAKYLIMSLWQVPDKQTSLLMTTFYKKWLEEKMSIPNAFHAAQKDLREAGLDPYYWAGFVLVE